MGSVVTEVSRVIRGQSNRFNGHINLGSYGARGNMRIKGDLAREARSGAAGKRDVGSVQAQMPMPIIGPCSRQARGEESLFPPGEP